MPTYFSASAIYGWAGRLGGVGGCPCFVRPEETDSPGRGRVGGKKPAWAYLLGVN